MDILKYSDNPNGKLFNDTWSDMREDIENRFEVGKEFEIRYHGVLIGVAKVVASRKFQFGQLRDVGSYINCGHNSFYQANLLKRFYGAQIKPEDTFSHVVLQWVSREVAVQTELLQSWWSKKNDLFSHEHTDNN